MDIAVAAFIFQISASDLALDLAVETSTINPNLKKLYTTCIASKSIQIIKRHKSITLINEKLEEVHVNL